MPTRRVKDDAAATVRTPAAKPLMLVGSGVLLAALVLVVVINIDTGTRTQSDADDFDEIIELLPERLTAQDQQSPVLDPRTANQPPVLAEGGWIQIADKQTGNLVQQYRCDRLDPNPPGVPPGWVRMDQPRAEIYLSQNRVLSLSGDSALAHVPHRVLESGTLTGDVTIRLFEPPPGRTVNLRQDTPSLVVHTGKARFDDFLGEVRCDGAFHIETPSAEFRGRGLTLLINDQGEQVQLTADVEQVEFIRLASQEQAPQGAEATSPPLDGARLDQAARADADEDVVPSNLAAPDATVRAPSAPEARPRSESASDETPQFYRLTLHDDVRIQQGNGTSGRTVTGEMLTIVFSPQSEGLAPALAVPGHPHHLPQTRTVFTGRPPHQLPLADALVVAAFASYAQPPDMTQSQRNSIAPPPRDDDIYIRCLGSLTMVPITDASEHLASARDARLELTGRPVRLFDTDKEAEAQCDHLVYRAPAKTVELIGSSTHPLSLRTPQLEAGGERFWLSQADNVGGFAGPGWAIRGHEKVRSSSPAAPTSPDGPQSDVARPQHDEPQPEPLHITWNEGVDLEFDEPADAESDSIGGNLRRAVFRGNVEVLSDEGAITCNNLDFGLGTDEQGKTIPATMVATGDVKAADPEQTVWADRLRVTFRQRRAAEDQSPDSTERRDLIDAGDAEVETLTAEGDVQVLLANGARAFADTLIGDAVHETVELAGSNVVVVYGKMLIDHGNRVVLRKETETAHWDGPGEARLFGAPIETITKGRVARPSIDDEAQVRVGWETSMLYDNTTADGAGAIDFHGNVAAMSRPDPLEVNTISAEALTLRFAKTDGDGEIDQDRAISRLIARGDAKFENRSWITENHSDQPRVFYVAGEHVEYDDQTGEALVQGAGELLIRDLRKTDDPDASTPLGTRGTTAFHWDQDLHMTREVGSLYHIVMAGQVQMRHLSPDSEATTLTCETLEAMIDRPGTAQRDSEMDLGGPAELQRLRAEGSVFLRTATRDVDCDEFEYDVATGIAELTAGPGRLVTVHTRGAPLPVRMQRAIWNMKQDSLTAVGVSGGGGD